MRLKPIYFLLLISISSLGLKAQDMDYTQPTPAKDQPVRHRGVPASTSLFDPNKLFWGGDLGAYFSFFTEISFSPLIGYRITDRLEVGIRGTYMYFNDHDYNSTSSFYGASVFGRVIIVNNFFIQGEYEVLNMPSEDFIGTRANKNFTFAGVGFKRPIGPNSYTTLVALWDLNYNADYSSSPYFQPDIRIGFNFGF